MTYSSKQARQMGLNKKLGNAGEQTAANALRQRGVLMVEEIGTPFVVVERKAGGWMRGYWKEKVSGDLRGHLSNGTSVIAEVKTIWNRNLRWSDLDSHQPGRLDMHAENAISLLVWVHSSGVYVMNWYRLMASGVFGPRQGLTIEQAEQFNIEQL